MIPRERQAEGAAGAAGITPATGAREASPQGEAERKATIAGSEKKLKFRIIIEERALLSK